MSQESIESFAQQIEEEMSDDSYSDRDDAMQNSMCVNAAFSLSAAENPKQTTTKASKRGGASHNSLVGSSNSVNENVTATKRQRVYMVPHDTEQDSVREDGDTHEKQPVQNKTKMISGLVAQEYDAALREIVPKNVVDLNSGNSQLQMTGARKQSFMLPNKNISRIGHVTLNGIHQKANKHWQKVPYAAVSVLKDVVDAEHGPVFRWCAIYKGAINELKLLPQAKVNEILTSIENKEINTSLREMRPKGDNQKLDLELQDWEAVRNGRVSKRPRAPTQSNKNMFGVKPPTEGIHQETEANIPEVSDTSPGDATGDERKYYTLPQDEAICVDGNVGADVKLSGSCQVDKPQLNDTELKGTAAERKRVLNHQAALPRSATMGDQPNTKDENTQWLGSLKRDPGYDVLTRISADGTTISIYQVKP